MHILGLNYDVLNYLMTFLDAETLCQVAPTCTVFFELTTGSLVRHVRLRRSSEQVMCFSQSMLNAPTRILSMRSLRVGRGAYYCPTASESFVGDFAEHQIRTKTIFRMLGIVLKQAVNLVSVELVYPPGLFGDENIAKALLPNGPHITELTLMHADLHVLHLRDVFQQLRDTLRQVHLIDNMISHEMDLACVLEPLQSTLEVLTINNVGNDLDISIQHRRQWPRVYELSLHAFFPNKREILYAFPNLRRLRVDKPMFNRRILRNKRFEKLDSCRPMAASTNMDILAGNLELILSLGPMGTVMQVDLCVGLSDTFIGSGAGPYLDFLKSASPRCLSLSIDSEDVAKILFDPRILSVVPELRYLTVRFEESASQIELSEITVSNILRVYSTLQTSNIVYLFISIALRASHHHSEVSRLLADQWLPLFSDSIQSLQYVGFEVIKHDDSRQRACKWYRVRDSEKQASESLCKTNVCEDAGSERKLQEVDRDVGKLLLYQCIAAE